MNVLLLALCALFATAEQQKNQLVVFEQSPLDQVVVFERFPLDQSTFQSRADLLCQNNRDQIVGLYERVKSTELQPVVDKFLMMQCHENLSIPESERDLIVKLAKNLSDDKK